MIRMRHRVTHHSSKRYPGPDTADSCWSIERLTLPTSRVWKFETVFPPRNGECNIVWKPTLRKCSSKMLRHVFLFSSFIVCSISFSVCSVLYITKRWLKVARQGGMVDLQPATTAKPGEIIEGVSSLNHMHHISVLPALETVTDPCNRTCVESDGSVWLCCGSENVEYPAAKGSVAEKAQDPNYEAALNRYRTTKGLQRLILTILHLFT